MPLRGGIKGTVVGILEEKMKKLIVAASLLLMSVSAWGQSIVVAEESEKTFVDIADCAAAIAHRDAIKVLEAFDLPDSSVSVLLLRDRGGLKRGYYWLYHEHIQGPLYTECWYYPIK